AVPGEVYLKLLAWNDLVMPFHFALDEKRKRVYLQFSLPNTGISSDSLNVWIERFAGHIKRTSPDWTFDVLQPAKPVVDSESAAKARKKLLGTWVVDSFERNGVKQTGENFKGFTYTFEGTVCVLGAKTKRSIVVAIDPDEKPAHLEFRIDLGKVEK